MEEMFLSKGFNDYLAKPIEISKLNALMDKWIAPEKKIKITGTVPEEFEENEDGGLLEGKRIEGIDINRGLERYRNGFAYLAILRSYADSVPEFLDTLRDVTPENLKTYAITVHGIKGASYQICAEEAGRQAEALEAAAKAGNWETIKNTNGIFIGNLEILLANIRDLLAHAEKKEDKPRRPVPEPGLFALLLAACKEYDITQMEEVLTELERYSYESGDELVAWLRRQFDNFDYEKIQERLEDLY
jgi:CheY-like chemotaxis protein